MANTSYTTITLLKARLSVTDSAADTPLQNILNSAAAVVDQGTRNPPPGVEAFSVSASATRYYDDRLTTDGVIDIDDAQTVTALTRASQTVTSTYYTLYPYNKGLGPYTRILFLASGLTFPYLYQLATAGGLAYHYPYRNVGVKQIAVTGTWGYCSAATDFPEVVEATLQIAIRMWEQQNYGVSGDRLAVWDPKDESDPITQMLAPHMKTEGRFAV
jgi:hypothetical protein